MPKKKRVRRLKPYEKVQNFLDKYKELCVTYDVPVIEDINILYDPIIQKHGRKLPQSIQWAETLVHPTHLRPLIEAYKNSDIKIRFLSFLNTQTGDEGLHVLSHFFEPPMEIAGFQYNSEGVGPSGARAIGRAMASSKTLAVLELDFNPEMGDEGVAGLLHYGHCETLNRLSLRFNAIGNSGAEAIGKWLALPNASVKELLLNGNQIGPQGAIALAHGLAQNKSLNRLDLSDNVFGYDAEALQALHDAIKSCPSLHFVSLYNHFECPAEMEQKFLELTQTKPLGECVLTVKMPQNVFQNTKAIALTNKRKLAKEAKKARLAAKKAAKDAKLHPQAQNTEEQPSQPVAGVLPPVINSPRVNTGVSPDPPPQDPLNDSALNPQPGASSNTLSPSQNGSEAPANA